MLWQAIEAEMKLPPVFFGTDTSLDTPTYQIHHWAAHTFSVPFDPTLSWTDAVKQAGPDGVADANKWPRDQILSASAYFPRMEQPREKPIEVVYACMHAHRMTGIAWQGKRWMFPNAVRGWAEANNLRPTTPRECLAAGKFAAERYDVLSTHNPEGIRVASLFIHNLGVHPKTRWVTRKEDEWMKKQADCFFSVALTRAGDSLRKVVCLDYLGQGDYFGAGYWFTFVRT